MHAFFILNSFSIITVWICNFLAQDIAAKAARKMLVKLTLCLNVIYFSSTQINPDLDRSHELKGWYEEEGARTSFTSLTQSGPRGGGGADFSAGAKMMTFAEAKSENIGMTDKVEYFSATATVSTFRKENALYQACANDKDGKTCNKKVLYAPNNLVHNKFVW